MPKNIYRLQDGTVVPGCTTIVSQLDKPQLIQWAWKLGTEGKDWKEERDSAGDIGTQVHDMVLAFLSGDEPKTPDNDTVTQCFSKFLTWWHKQVGFNDGMEIITESPFVSEKYGFGGQPDIFLITKRRIIDVKTSNGIYENYWLQLAGYDILLRDNGYKPKEYQILWLPKDDRFDAPIRTDLKKEKEIFKHLVGIYKLRHND